MHHSDRGKTARDFPRMTSRQRFAATMGYENPDRVPYFEEGIREDVIAVWRKQGLPQKARVADMFPCDQRERIEIDLEPRPKMKTWPDERASLDEFNKHLNPHESKRLPAAWAQKVKAWQHRNHVLMLHVHRGLFLSMGVYDWRSFKKLMHMLMTHPQKVRKAMQIQGDFSARLTEIVLKEVQIDAAVFSEPIGGNDRPLISPRMYEDIVLNSYKPILDVLQRYAVRTIIFQTFANARILIPGILRRGFNCLWACEVNIEAMDYRDLRHEFGRDLRLIGGIDLDALRRDKAAIQKEIEEKVPALIADGGYVPLADGRIRSDVPFENYVYYRRLLEKITRGDG